MSETLRFEITFDPKEEAAMAGLQLDPDRHQLLPVGPWLSYMRRECAEPRLILYEHLVYKTIVMGLMLYPPNIVMELETFNEHPDRAEKPPSLAFIRARLEPAEEMHNRLTDRLRDHRAARAVAGAESEEEREDAVAWLRRQGHDDVAASLATRAYVGGREGGESLDMMKDALQRMVRVAD